MRTATPSTIKTCLKEAATPLHLLGLHWPQICRRLLHQSPMYSASQKYLLHSKCSTLSSNGSPMWYIEPRLATLRELVGLRDLWPHWTVGDPRWPRITGLALQAKEVCSPAMAQSRGGTWVLCTA